MGYLFAERLNRTNGEIPKRLGFEKGDGNWIDVLSVMTKQYNNRLHTSTELTPIHAGLKTNEGSAYKNLKKKEKK